MRLPHRQASRLEATQFSERWTPTFGQTFAAASYESARMTSVLALNNIAEIEYAALAGEEIGQEEWKSGPLFRDGVTWRQGMTRQEALILSDRHDERKRNELVLSRGGTGAMLAGGLVGSLIDPLNYVMILGPAARAASVARMGKIAGTAAIAAKEAGIAVGLMQPLLFAQAAEFGENYDLMMAAENVAVATTIGAGFGAILGGLSRHSEIGRVRAARKAISDMQAGRPVDVAAELSPKSLIEADVRSELILREKLSGVSEPAGPPGARSMQERIAARPGDPRLEPGFEQARGPEMSQQEQAREIVDILQKPGFERTADEKVLLERVDVTPEMEEAIRIQAKPGRERTAEDMVTLKAFEDGKLDELIEGRIAENERQIAKVREELTQTKGLNIKETLGKEARLVAENQRLQGRLLDTRNGKPLDFSVARDHPAAPGDPAKIAEEVAPTTAKNVYEDGEIRPAPEPVEAKPGEKAPEQPARTAEPVQADQDAIDLAALQEEIAGLERDKLTVAGDRKELDGIQELRKRADDKWRKAFKEAASCVFNNPD